MTEAHAAQAVVEIAGRQIVLSNLDKPLYPDVVEPDGTVRGGWTKGELIDYYARIAPAMLPHIADRPMTLRRFPDGVLGGSWYDKRCLRRPEWMRSVRAPSVLEAGKVLEFCLLDDVAALVWAANQAAIELHPNLGRAPDINVPAVVAFDLDPGPPAGLVDALDVALGLRDMLADLGLDAWPKTTGGKGLHVFVPLGAPATPGGRWGVPHSYAQTKAFARGVADLLARELPDRVTARMAKGERPGRVFVDWSQNDPTKTTVAVYSVRARRTPTVSAPVTWDEVQAAATSGDARRLVFSPAAVLGRVAEFGDLFAPVAHVRQELPAAVT